jgi:hypothetical protein
LQGGESGIGRTEDGWKFPENEHILRKQCQDLYKPARAEQISAAIFLLFHFEYRIFHFHQTK